MYRDFNNNNSRNRRNNDGQNENRETFSFVIPKERLVFKNEKAHLFTLPENSKYDNYNFWVNNRMVRKDQSENFIVSYWDADYKYKVSKKERTPDRSWKVIDEKNISISEIADIFKA